jgi:hypothetical protein
MNTGRRKPLDLMDCIDSKHFDNVLTSAQTLGGAYTDDTGRQALKHPSNSKNLGHSLVKCANLKKREGIIRRDKNMEKEADRFIALYKADWNDHVGRKALTTLKMKRQKGPEALPTSEDLIKLKEYLDARLRRGIDQLKSQYSYTAYRNLLEHTLASIILFNKRRGGETSKLLLQSYISRSQWKQNANKEIMNSLNEVEKQLLNR